MAQNHDQAWRENGDFSVPGERAENDVEPVANQNASRLRSWISRNRLIAIGVSLATGLIGTAIGRSVLQPTPETAHDRARQYVSQYQEHTHPVDLALSRAVRDRDMDAAQILAELYVKENLPLFGVGFDQKTSMEAWTEAVTGRQEIGGADEARVSAQIDMVNVMIVWAQKYNNVKAATLAGRYANSLGAYGDSEATHALRLKVLDVEISLGRPSALMDRAEANAEYSTQPKTYGSEEYAQAALNDASKAKQDGLQGSIESYAHVLTTLALGQPHNRRLVNSAIAAWNDFNRWVVENDSPEPGYEPQLENREGFMSWDRKTANLLTALKQGDLYLAAGDFETAADLSRPHTLKFIEPSDDLADYQNAVVQNYAEALLSQAVLPNADGTRSVDPAKIDQAFEAVTAYNKLVRDFYEPRGADNWRDLNEDFLEDINRFRQEVGDALRRNALAPTWSEVESATAYGSSLCLPNGSSNAPTPSTPTLTTC